MGTLADCLNSTMHGTSSMRTSGSVSHHRSCRINIMYLAVCLENSVCSISRTSRKSKLLILEVPEKLKGPRNQQNHDSSLPSLLAWA